MAPCSLSWLSSPYRSQRRIALAFHSACLCLSAPPANSKDEKRYKKLMRKTTLTSVITVSTPVCSFSSCLHRTSFNMWTKGHMYILCLQKIAAKFWLQWTMRKNNLMMARIRWVCPSLDSPALKPSTTRTSLGIRSQNLKMLTIYAPLISIQA